MQRRYFLEIAKDANYPHDRAELILNDMLEKTEYVIQNVLKLLPNDFPQDISEPIFQGLAKMKTKLL